MSRVRRPAASAIATFSLAVAVAVAVAVAGCGGGERDGAPVRTGEGPEHIHGLGVNPADGSLVIATHSGMFRAAPGRQRAERVGDNHQDTMGFTVLGPDRFLGSGHPDLRTDLPPLLGLIRSDDAGRTWKPVSLLGKADFHVLRAVGRRVYAVNAGDGQLLVSDDGGRAWSRYRPPGAVLDLVPNPDSARHVIASGERELYVSRDGGETWRRAAAARAGLLAWTRDDALFVVDAQGSVHRSADGGDSWERVGEVGGQPAAFASAGIELYVALHSNEVKVSRDGGRSWQTRVTA